jgi:hypothetical protein
MLLNAGILAGPFYILVGLIQIFIRDGFDPARHALSLLTLGNLGWIQIVNFEVTGVLLVAAAVGMRRVIRTERGGTWGALLIGLYGAGLIGAGIFLPDAALGFPPGTPAEAGEMSLHGMMHFVVGSLGFIGLIGACFVFARRFFGLKSAGWGIYSVATGVLFFVAFAGIASGTASAALNVAFGVAVVIGFVWVSAVFGKLRTERSTLRAAADEEGNDE